MPAFYAGGEKGLFKAYLEQVRKEFEAELAAATGHWERVAIEAKIAQEAKRRWQETSSPQALWSSK